MELRRNLIRKAQAPTVEVTMRRSLNRLLCLRIPALKLALMGILVADPPILKVPCKVPVTMALATMAVIQIPIPLQTTTALPTHPTYPQISYPTSTAPSHQTQILCRALAKQMTILARLEATMPQTVVDPLARRLIKALEDRVVGLALVIVMAIIKGADQRRRRGELSKMEDQDLRARVMGRRSSLLLKTRRALLVEDEEEGITEDQLVMNHPTVRDQLRAHLMVLLGCLMKGYSTVHQQATEEHHGNLSPTFPSQTTAGILCQLEICQYRKLPTEMSLWAVRLLRKELKRLLADMSYPQVQTT